MGVDAGRTRAYVAKTPGELFPGWPASKAHRYSRPPVTGWYIDTNLNRERMRRILPAAVAAAGLKWGQDMKTYWRASNQVSQACLMTSMTPLDHWYCWSSPSGSGYSFGAPIEP